MNKFTIILSVALTLVGCSEYKPSVPSSETTGSSSKDPGPVGNPRPSPSPGPVQTPAPAPVPVPVPTPQPPPQTCAPVVGGQISIASFNVDPSGARDSSAEIQKALNCAKTLGVGVIFVPRGTYLFATANELKLGSGQALVGEGSGLSIFKKAAGLVLGHMILIQDVQNVTVAGIGFQGNGVITYSAEGNPVPHVGRAISIWAANADVAQITIRDSGFKNFSTDCWVCFTNYTQDFGMYNLVVQNNTFESFDGNAMNPQSIGYAASAIWIGGSMYLPRPSAAHPSGGLVTEAYVRNNQFYIPHIKNGVTVWANTEGIHIANNLMDGVGISGAIPDDKGAYAILVYDNAYRYNADGSYTLTGGLSPNNVVIDSNRLLRVHSCGVYAADANTIYVQNNVISDQYDRVNVTLPKGAIALNGPRRAVVTGNTILNSVIGLGLYGKPAGDSIISTANNSIQVRAGGYGIWVQNYANDLIQISNTPIDVSAGGIAYHAPIAGGTIQYQ